MADPQKALSSDAASEHQPMDTRGERRIHLLDRAALILEEGGSPIEIEILDRSRRGIRFRCHAALDSGALGAVQFEGHGPSHLVHQVEVRWVHAVEDGEWEAGGRLYLAVKR